MCHCYNSDIDLQQEGPYFLSCTFLAESDSGVTRTKKSYVGEPLTKFWLLTSVGENDSDSGVTWTKKKAPRGNPLQDFGCLLQLVKLTLILE